MSRFSLQVNTHSKNPQEDTIEITCFGKWANFTGRVLRKGDSVKIAGRLKTLPDYTPSIIQYNTFVIASMVEILNPCWQTINQRKIKWHYFDEVNTQKLCASMVATGADTIPQPIKRIFFFSKSLQTDVYWRYCCLRSKLRRKRKAATRT